MGLIYDYLQEVARIILSKVTMSRIIRSTRIIATPRINPLVGLSRGLSVGVVCTDYLVQIICRIISAGLFSSVLSLVSGIIVIKRLSTLRGLD
jgi:hypothetical protein